MLLTQYENSVYVKLFMCTYSHGICRKAADTAVGGVEGNFALVDD